MARYRDVDMQPKFIPVDFAKQILPGTFEHALHVLIDHELDLSPFSAALKNDLTGAPAYHPGVLLKIVLFAYSRGIVSSRRIEAACRDHIVFIALSGDSQPHFSTIASFVADHGKAIANVFTQVLMVCDRQGLIGRDMFAIDGVKLPSNAAKAKSGRRADFEREAAKIESAVTRIIEQHQSHDATKTDPDDSPANVRKLERMKKEARTIRQWLEDHPTDRPGAGKATRLSNRTDNESAKMATDKGVVQGYCGVGAVDQRQQIIVEAQAHGTGSEQGLLTGIVDALQPVMHKTTVLVADAGYHSDANVERLEVRKIDAFIADNGYRQRDERYADQGKHKDEPDPLWDKRPKDKQAALSQWRELQHRWAQSGEVQRRQVRLHRMPPESPVPAASRAHPHPIRGRVPRPARRCARDGERAHEATHPQPAGACHDQPSLRHRRARVRQHPAQQGARSIHAARQNESRGPVEALLPGAQHRKARAPRVPREEG
jgi:transposase